MVSSGRGLVTPLTFLLIFHAPCLEACAYPGTSNPSVVLYSYRKQRQAWLAKLPAYHDRVVSLRANGLVKVDVDPEVGCKRPTHLTGYITDILTEKRLRHRCTILPLRQRASSCAACVGSLAIRVKRKACHELRTNPPLPSEPGLVLHVHVYGALYMLNSKLYIVQRTWYMLHRPWYVVLSTQYIVHSLWYIVPGT